MKSTNAERMNLPIRESRRAESCGGVMKFRARWQTAVDTASVTHHRSSVWSWPLPFQNYSLTSTRWSNDNDRNLNLLRPSDLPVSA
jgi:hypothetical protein